MAWVDIMTHLFMPISVQAAGWIWLEGFIRDLQVVAGSCQFHLGVFAGMNGHFGASTPARIEPNAMIDSLYASTGYGDPVAYGNNICYGADFSRNAKIKVKKVFPCTDFIWVHNCI